MSPVKKNLSKVARRKRPVGAGSTKIKPKAAEKIHSRPASPILNVDRSWFAHQFRVLEMSQRALANALGRNPSAVTQLLKGERRVTTGELPVLARFFGVQEDEIMRRLGVLPAHPVEGSETIDISGWVNGDLLVHHEAPPGPRKAPCPLPAVPGLRALRVQSAGTANAFMDGAVVYYVASEAAVAPDAVERLCIVRLASAGPERLRVVRHGYVRGAFNLFDQRGTLLEQNVLLAAASPVLWMRL